MQVTSHLAFSVFGQRPHFVRHAYDTMPPPKTIAVSSFLINFISNINTFSYKSYILILFGCLFIFFVSLSFGARTEFLHSKILSVNDTIIINDTVFVYDTVYVKKLYTDTVFLYDTVVYPVLPTLKSLKFRTEATRLKHLDFPVSLIHRTSKFSVGIAATFAYPKIHFESGPASSDYRELLNIALNPTTAWSVGAAGMLHRRKVDLVSGMNYTQISQLFTHTEIITRVDTIMKYKFFNRTEIDFDTIWFVNIDTLLATGDTLWTAYLDTNYVNVRDSVLVFEPDTTQTFAPVHAKNKYRYFEIPLMLKIKLYNGVNYKIFTEIGIFSGFFLDSSGKIVSLRNQNGSEPIDKYMRFSPVLFSSFIGFSLDVPLSNRLNMNVGVYRKDNLNAMFTNNPVSIRHSFTGLHFKIFYRI